MQGARIANYLVQQKLGSGGMGVVYKGVDLNLDRPVAIKVLAPELARDLKLVERFRQEARALANLSHPNIAMLYSLQEAAGQYFMVMEYLQGETLEALIRARGRIAYDQACSWCKQALLGIGFAHARGIIHRDIKPANIILVQGGVVKVMDFGIAKVLGGGGLNKSSTQMGTAAYMSPEQIRRAPVDARSDIYSLSVTLFEMLTGRLPFSGASDYEMMSAHLRMAPRRTAEFCPEIPEFLEAAVLKGLEKNPAMRFQTAESFGAALEDLKRPVKPAPVAPVQAPALVAPRGLPASPKPAPIVGASSMSPGKAGGRVSGPLCLTMGVALLCWLVFEGLYHENAALLLASAVLLYFLPILVAAMSLKRNGARVVKLNALRGWTGIGWIEAMKHALTDERR
jgi:serine/threonine protein kinase